jgi:hypothetical protein
MFNEITSELGLEKQDTIIDSSNVTLFCLFPD